MEISKLKLNDKNPRFINDDKFRKLVISIQEFPKMLELRPIIYDNLTFEILGGNMRYQALKELRYKEIPDNWVKSASELTEEEKKRFIIEDNVGFGEWDWSILANEWDKDQLNDWGLTIHNFAEGLDVNNMSDNDNDIDQEFDPIGNSDGLQRVVFIFDGKNEAESYLSSIKISKFSKKGQAWQVNMSTRSI